MLGWKHVGKPCFIGCFKKIYGFTMAEYSISVSFCYFLFVAKLGGMDDVLQINSWSVLDLLNRVPSRTQQWFQACSYSMSRVVKTRHWIDGWQVTCKYRWPKLLAWRLINPHRCYLVYEDLRYYSLGRHGNCFKDHTLANPLSCKGGVLTRLSAQCCTRVVNLGCMRDASDPLHQVILALLLGSYPPVIQQSYVTWPFTLSFPIEKS